MGQAYQAGVRERGQRSIRPSIPPLPSRTEPGAPRTVARSATASPIRHRETSHPGRGNLLQPKRRSCSADVTSTSALARHLSAQGMRPAAYRTPITGATSTTITRLRSASERTAFGRPWPSHTRSGTSSTTPAFPAPAISRPCARCRRTPRTVKVLAVAAGEYWTRPQELFARAHAQYIAWRSGSRRMREELSSGRTTSSPRSPGRWTVCSRRRAGWYGRIERGPRLLGAPVAGTHRSRRQARDRFPR